MKPQVQEPMAMVVSLMLQEKRRNSKQPVQLDCWMPSHHLKEHYLLLLVYC